MNKLLAEIESGKVGTNYNTPGARTARPHNDFIELH
jgi:hypothetical protein